MLLGRGLVCVAHDHKQSRNNVRAYTTDETESALVLVVDGGRPRLWSINLARREQQHFGRPEAEIIEAGAGTVGMLDRIARIGRGVNAVGDTEGADCLARVVCSLLRAEPRSTPLITVHSLPAEATLLGAEQTRADKKHDGCLQKGPSHCREKPPIACSDGAASSQATELSWLVVYVLVAALFGACRIEKLIKGFGVRYVELNSANSLQVAPKCVV